jgi:hypothetical protein
MYGHHVSVDSNYDDATVFVNGENTGYTVEDLYYSGLGPVPTDGSVEVHVEKDFPWGTVSTEPVAIFGSDEYDFDIDPLTEELKQEIMDTVNKFEEEWTYAVKNLDASVYTTLTDDNLPEYVDFVDRHKEQGYKYEGKGITRAVYDLDSFEYSKYSSWYSSTTEHRVYVEVNTIYLGGWVQNDDPQQKQEALNDTEENDNLWNFLLIYDEEDQAWKIDDSYNLGSFDPENKKEYEF